jgi:TonB family protein
MKYLNYIIIAVIFYSTNIFSQEGLVKSFYSNDTLKSEVNYTNNVKQGAAKYYYPNGKLQLELNYTNGKVEGVVKDYYDNGNVKEVYTIENGKRNGAASLFEKDGKFLKDLIYDNGKLVPEEIAAIDTSANQTTQNSEQNKLSDKINQLKNETSKILVPPAEPAGRTQFDLDYLDSVDVKPEPAGGIKNILNKLIYPERAKDNNIQGIVKIRAYIDEYGEVIQDEVIQGIGFGCDESAKISVYYTKFVPGILKGKPIKAQVVLPIEFKLLGK